MFQKPRSDENSQKPRIKSQLAFQRIYLLDHELNARAIETAKSIQVILLQGWVGCAWIFKQTDREEQLCWQTSSWFRSSFAAEATRMIQCQRGWRVCKLLRNTCNQRPGWDVEDQPRFLSSKNTSNIWEGFEDKWTWLSSAKDAGVTNKMDECIIIFIFIEAYSRNYGQKND